MITAVTQKSFIYSVTHTWGRADLWETAVVESEAAWPRRCWRFGARESFVAGAVQLYRGLLSAICHKNHLFSAGRENQNCLQTLPKVPRGTKFSPVEKHRPSGSDTL